MCIRDRVQLLVPGMKESNYGRIINITSTSVKEPLNDLGLSNSLRAAVSNWAKTLANELGRFNITVNNVLPGYTSTERLNELFSFRAKNLNVDQSMLEDKAMEMCIRDRSSTRREELLMDKESLQRMFILRNHLADMKPDEAIEFMLKHMQHTSNNEEFLQTMNS